MSTHAAELEWISPELVLVSQPELAARARALLPPPPESTLDRLAARLREQPAPPVAVPQRRSPRRLLVAATLVLVLAAAAAAYVERPRPLRPYFAAPATALRHPAAAATPAPVLAATPVTIARPAAPATGSFVPARVWLWAPDARATAYLFELSADGRVALRLHTTEPRLELPRTFRFHAGTYRWSVHALGAPGTAPLTDSSFTLTPRSAALANR